MSMPLGPIIIANRRAFVRPPSLVAAVMDLETCLPVAYVCGPGYKGGGFMALTSIIVWVN